MRSKLAVFLLAAVLAACSDPPLRIQIPFVVEFAGREIDCGTGNDIELTDLRFYVSDIQLVDAAGNTEFLDPGLALLDFEDGSGSCSNGTPDTQAALRGMVAGGEYRALRFTVGVPFELNHRDPLLADPPLGDAAMHWHWRGGYKFLRAGVRNASDSFWLHLGSTGCEGTLQNITGCNAPNRVSVALDNFLPGRDVVVIDLAELVAAGTLDDGVASDCSSGPAEVSCTDAFAAFGLDHATGTTSALQRVFSSRSSP